jgi:hypothetical protein
MQFPDPSKPVVVDRRREYYARVKRELNCNDVDRIIAARTLCAKYANGTALIAELRGRWAMRPPLLPLLSRVPLRVVR